MQTGKQDNVSIKHSARLKPLSELVDKCIAPALAAQGFAASDVVLAWPEIVGERLARHTEPMRVLWPRRHEGKQADSKRTGSASSSRSAAFKDARSQQPATLVVRVTGAFALELQHMAPVVIERVNAHFGWRCIGQLAFRQGPITRRTVTAIPERHLNEAQEQMVQQSVREITDDPLRHALENLGRAVLAKGND